MKTFLNCWLQTKLTFLSGLILEAIPLKKSSVFEKIVLNLLIVLQITSILNENNTFALYKLIQHTDVEVI